MAGPLLAPLLARPVVAQAVAPPSPATARALGGLDQFVTSVMREWHVPGLAIGVIQDGRPAARAAPCAPRRRSGGCPSIPRHGARARRTRSVRDVGDAGVARPGARHRRHSGWPSRAPQGVRLAGSRTPAASYAAPAHGHRLPQQVVYRRADGHARGLGQARLGQARARLPRGFPAARRIREPGDDAARPGHAPRRVAEARPLLVRGESEPPGDVSAAEVSRAERLVPQPLAVPEPDVHDRGIPGRAAHWSLVGRSDPRTPLWALGDDAVEYVRAGPAGVGRCCPGIRLASLSRRPCRRERLRAASGRAGGTERRRVRTRESAVPKPRRYRSRRLYQLERR